MAVRLIIDGKIVFNVLNLKTKNDWKFTLWKFLLISVHCQWMGSVCATLKAVDTVSSSKDQNNHVLFITFTDLVVLSRIYLKIHHPNTLCSAHVVVATILHRPNMVSQCLPVCCNTTIIHWPIVVYSKQVGTLPHRSGTV